MHTRHTLPCLLATVVCAILCKTHPGVNAAEPIWPGKTWTRATPAEVGMDAEKLDAARRYALTGGGSGYVTRHGRLVAAWGDPRRRYDLKSTTKSIGVTALGLAIADGKLKLSDRAADRHPRFATPPASNADTGWVGRITLLHLATQTAGFEKPGGYTKLVFEPGRKWSYSDGGPNWLAECVTLAYQRDVRELMFERVFTPLGIGRSQLTWRRNAYRAAEIEGVPRREFGSGISADVDAMARIGYLYLREGQWRDKRILPREFVAQCRTTVRGVVGLPEVDAKNHGNASDHYGLLWWNNADGTIAGLPKDAYWSWGLYDSLVVVIPSLDVVVARAGKSWKRSWSGHYDVLKPFLEPIAASVTPAEENQRSTQKPNDGTNRKESVGNSRRERPPCRSDSREGCNDLPTHGTPRRAFPTAHREVVSEVDVGCIDKSKTARDNKATPPYPPSPVIQGINWAPADTVVRRARGGDNWPLTWADDDHLYTAYGDGRGFAPMVDKKLSLGLARVSGSPPDFRGVNVRSATGEQTGDGARGKKASGLLMVGGTLYLWVRNAGNSQLAWSTDRGQSWRWSDWRWTTSFGYPAPLNFGRDYAAARDDYVYVYSHDSDSAYQKADRMVLARASKDGLTRQDAWEYFAGLDGGGQPQWTKDIAGRRGVFEHPGRCYRSSVSYNAPLKRYLWCQILPGDDTRFAGGFGIYDAPRPWGPWTTVFFTDKWDMGPGETSHLPTKWISRDGRTVHLVFSGDDSFSVRRGKLMVRE